MAAKFNMSNDQQRILYSRQVSKERRDFFEQPISRRQVNLSPQGGGPAPATGQGRRCLRTVSRAPVLTPTGGSGGSFPAPFRHSFLCDCDPILLEAYRSDRRDQIARLLTIKGVTAEVDKRKTMADVAAEDGRNELLELLKTMYVDFNRPNAEGMVPLHYAVRKRHYRTVQLLHKLGASPDIAFPSVSGKGHSDYPLHVACANSDEKMLDILLDHCCASVDVVDAQGNTPLHRACLEDSLMAVKRLMPHFDSEVLNRRGHEGKTALHIAVLNQNRQIVDLLLRNGTLVDVPADNGKTVIDIILQLNNPMLLNDIARFYSLKTTEGTPARNLMALSHEPHFQQYLEFLSNVDNEFSECVMELNDISDSEKEVLSAKLQNDDRIDVIEFREVILQLLQTEDIHHMLEDREVLVKIVENIVHYVLFREDAVMLERIMYCGVLWSRVSLMMEDHLDSLYAQAPERDVNGFIMHFKSSFVEDGIVQYDKLANFYSQELSCYNLQPYYLGFSRGIQYMRHPMKTLPVWSVLSGRLALTELLLRQEKFDVVPLSLFCAALLRTFPRNQELMVEEDEIQELALTCEKFARKIVEKVHSIDTSYSRFVSVDYLVRPLESYGDVSCVKLAASNECSTFLQSELCQRALDKMWYRSLLNVNAFLREIIIWLGAIPMNFVVPLMLLYFDEKEMRIRRSHEERSFATEDQSTQRFAKFHLPPRQFFEPVLRCFDEAAKRRGSSNHSLGAMGNDNHRQPLGKGKPRESEHREQSEEVEFLPHGRSVSKATDKSDNSSLLPDHDRYLPDHEPVASAVASLVIHNEMERMSVLSSIRTRALRRCGRFFELIIEFYSIPAVKFRYHIAAHIILVALMSYLLLMDFEYKIKKIEMVVYAILSGMLLEEIGEFAQHREHNDLRSYFRSKWNLIDITALSCGAVGFVIRMCEMKYSSELGPMLRDFEDKAWYTARILLSICCTLYWIRLLYISTVLKNLGPKLKMIAKMITKDLLPFLFILFIFILGFGVLMHSLLYPNGFRAWNYGQLNKVHVLLGMLKICFYSMVGEYSLDTIMGDEMCEQIYSDRLNNTHNCPHHFGRYLVPYLILPLYVIVTEILLLNLIVAMFSKTIEKIDSRSKGLWQFERYDLIEEFETRSSLPPPLNVFVLVRKLGLLIRRSCQRLWCRDCCSCSAKATGKFKQQLVTQFLLFQAFSLRNCREDLMRQCLPKQETEAEEMLMKVRQIVENEVNKLLSVSSNDSPEGAGDDSQGGSPMAKESITVNTLLEAKPPAASQPLPSGTRSLNSLAVDEESNVGGVSGRCRVRLRELV